MEYPWASFLGSGLASVLFLWTMAHRYLPPGLRSFLSGILGRIFITFYSYIDIKINEYTGDRIERSTTYVAIQSYLMATTAKRARRLKAQPGGTTSKVVVTMDDNEQITDEFCGAKVWWKACARPISSQTISLGYSRDEVRRFYKLSFHSRYRDLVVNEYLPHVMKEGETIKFKNRQRKLFMNTSGKDGRRGSLWRHVLFEHPATFQTLAMEPEKKKEIIEDLVTFSDAQEYYVKIGKAWKRGYLLYGPPGTGKSTMIAAMANFLNYDVYDLELTSVKDNTQLRELLVEITNKSIIVIEDIDCSLDLTGERNKKAKKAKEDEETDKKKKMRQEEDSTSQVTLSGLLNSIDGLWSACRGERIIIFTTNYLEKLDPALIRRGRMDMRIEMSYCSFEGFKVLAKNYLDLDSHPLFENIRLLMEGSKIVPADVAENLMPKSSILTAEENATDCLEKLIQELQIIKEESLRKAQEVRGEESSTQEPAAEDGDAATEGRE